MVISLSITEDTIEFSNDGELVGKLYKRHMHPENIAAFAKANYNLQGTVKYDAWVAGAFAGLSLLLGEHMIGPEDRALIGDGTGEASLLPGEVGGVETIVAVSESPAVASSGELDLVVDGIPHNSTPAGTEENLGGLTPSRSPESETIVPSAETPAAVGETIVPVSESPAAVSEETRGLTPPGSPEPGVVSP